MKKTLVASTLAIAALLPALAVAQDKKAPEPDWKFSGNMTLASEYIYRGISQTNFLPSIQGGFDVAHSSGFYAGNWNSNISWLSDATPGLSAPIEMDLYAGYKFSVGPVSMDAGGLFYYYPTKGVSLAVNPNTLEGYFAAGWGPVTAKLSIAGTELFGVAGSEMSSYFDVSASFAIPGGVTITPHIGRQTIRTDGSTPTCADGSQDWSYFDANVKATYDLAGWTLGAMVSGTDAKKACWAGVIGGKNLGRTTLVLSVGRTF
jgi:uncharacterized protein (TIGR02001 family)